MAEFGILQGLSQDLNYDKRINDARYHEQENRRAALESEAKSKMFADDLDFQNAANQHDAPLIREFAKNKVKEIGKYVRENPDWVYNTDKRLQLNLMKRDLKDNPELNRGIASDTAYKSFIGDLQEVAKNPNSKDTEAYNLIHDKWNNYLQYGNQDGLDAFQKEGKKAFLYTKPKDFVNDLSGDLHKTGLGIKDFQVVKPRNGNSGEYWTAPTEDALNAATEAKYQEHKRQIEVQGPKMGLYTPEQQKEWLKKNVLAGFNKEYHLGDPDSAFNKSMRLMEFDLANGKKEKPISSSYTPFDYITDPKTKAGTIPTDVLNKSLSDKPYLMIQGNHGSKTDLTGFNFDYDGRFVQRDGIPLVFGNIKIPLDVAKQKGIIGYNEKTGDDDRISSEFMGKAVIIPNKNAKGEDASYVQISHQLPINPKDQGFKQRYNALMDVDKYVTKSENPYKENSSKNVIEASKADFTAAGYSDEQINEAINRGLIKIK